MEIKLFWRSEEETRRVTGEEESLRSKLGIALPRVLGVELR
jgi:hypothetical protein